MDITDLLSIGAMVGALNIVLGLWVKARIEGSIKHEYDKKLEEIRQESKRSDSLFNERLAVFKRIQKKLVSIRRYCFAQAALDSGSEFSPRPDDLDLEDNKSVLSHWTELETILDENLIFLSNACKAQFELLRQQISLGASLELWLASDDPVPEIVASRSDAYLAMAHRVDKCVEALFKDLDFPNEPN